MAFSNMVIPTTAPLSSMSSMGGTFGRTMDVANNVPPLSSNSGGSGLSSLGSSLLSGGLGAAGSLLSGFINNLFAIRAQKRQFKYNQQLMNMQNELQRDMIQDDALLKLQGYKKAGLSTASLGGSFGNAASVPSQSVGAPQGSMPDLRLGDIFNAARQVKLQEEAIQSQINLNNANAESALANARSNIANAGITERYGSQEAERRIKQADENIKYFEAKTDTERANAKSIFKNVELTDAKINEINTLLGIKAQELGAYMQNVAANIAESKSRSALNYASANNQNAQARRSNEMLEGDLKMQGKNLVKADAEIKNLESQTGLNEKQILYLASLKEKAEAEKDFILARQYEQQFNNKVREMLGHDFYVNREKMYNLNQGISTVRNAIGVVGDAANIVY